MADDEDASIMTLKVCGLTSRYVSNGSDGQYLDRSCEPCPEEAPYSGGFQSAECIPCDQLPQEISSTLKPCEKEVVVEEPEPEPEPDTEDDDSQKTKYRRYKRLRPLEEDEFDWNPLLIFFAILVPFLLLFICITCYCKAQRRKKKEQLAKASLKASRSANRLDTYSSQQSRYETENDLLPTDGNYVKQSVDDKAVAWKLDKDEHIDQQENLRQRCSIKRVDTDGTEKAATERNLVEEPIKAEQVDVELGR